MSQSTSRDHKRDPTPELTNDQKFMMKMALHGVNEDELEQMDDANIYQEQIDQCYKMMRKVTRRGLKLIDEDMRKNTTKYTKAAQRALYSFAKEVRENQLERNRIEMLEAKVVEDNITAEIKFKEQLSKIIEEYNIKIDVEKMERERNKWVKVTPQDAEKRRNERALKRIIIEQEELEQ